MRILNFKQKYEFETLEGEIIEINPLERIIQGLKTSTFRLKPKHIEYYQLRQGNIYQKNNVCKTHIVKIFKIELRNIFSLTNFEMMKDIGFTKEEWEKLNITNESFFEAIVKINKLTKKKAKEYKQNPIGHFHYFETYQIFHCLGCRNDFYLPINEVWLKRNDICQNCIDQFVKEAVENPSSLNIKVNTVEEKRILKGI